MLKSVLNDVSYLQRKPQFGAAPQINVLQSRMKEGGILKKYSKLDISKHSRPTQQGIIIFIIPPSVRKIYLYKCVKNVEIVNKSIKELHITCGGMYNMHITCIFNNGSEARYGNTPGQKNFDIYGSKHLYKTGFDEDTLLCFLKNIFNDVGFNPEAKSICKIKHSKKKDVYNRLKSVYPDDAIKVLNNDGVIIENYIPPPISPIKVRKTPRTPPGSLTKVRKTPRTPPGSLTKVRKTPRTPPGVKRMDADEKLHSPFKRKSLPENKVSKPKAVRKLFV